MKISLKALMLVFALSVMTVSLSGCLSLGFGDDDDDKEVVVVDQP